MSSSTLSRYREQSNCDQNNTSFTEEYAFDAIAKEAELRLQYQREQTREARQIRSKELEKNARDSNDEEDLSIKPEISLTNSLFLQKFLNGDINLRSIEQYDLKRLLNELEMKYKSLMITNSSIYNENQSLHYQIDTYKDILDEQYELINQIKRQFKDKCRDFDLQKQILINYELNNHQLKEILINCDKLIEEEEKYYLNETINDKIKRILNEKHEQYKQIQKLKSNLNEEQNQFKILKEQISNSFEYVNQICNSEQEKQFLKEINDLKNRLEKFEIENSSLQQENKRYEAQLTRYKQQLDDVENTENELKQERRRLQREIRTARDELENERTRSDILQRENKRLRILRKKNLLNNTNGEFIISTNTSTDIQSNSLLEDSI